MAKKTTAKKSGGGKSTGVKALIVILLLIAAFGIFWNKATLVRVIDVSGVSETDKAAVIGRSGLNAEMHTWQIDESALEQALGALGQWEYIGFEQTGLGSVRIDMRTRTERAVVHYAGSSLVLDEYGQVMEHRRDDPEYSLMKIKGLEIVSAIVGHELGTTDKNQILSVGEVIRALDSTGAYSRVRELNAADLDNLYVITVNGMRVDLGDSSRIEEKCSWMNGVLDSLEAEGKYTGTIDVSAGTSAVYRPE